MSALPSAAQVTPAQAETAGSLCERYRNSILSYCWSRLGSREEAEDAAQTTFLNAFQALQRGVVPQYESAWLFAIADNVCRVRRRAAGRRSRVEFARDVQTLEETAAAHQPDSDELLGLAEALARLPERQRHALLLREWHGLSYEEIARELDISHAAVETLLFRARRSLAQDLSGAQDARPKRRLRSLDIASLLSALKSALGLGGGAALKTAVAVSALATATATIAVGVPDIAGPDRPDRVPASARSNGTGASGSEPAAGSGQTSGAGAQGTRGALITGAAGSAPGKPASLPDGVRPDDPRRSADRPGPGPAGDGPLSGDPRTEGGGAAPPTGAAPRGSDPGSSPTSPAPADQANGPAPPLSAPGLPKVPDVPVPPPPTLPEVPPLPQVPPLPELPPLPPVLQTPPPPPPPPLPQVPPVPVPPIPPPPSIPTPPQLPPVPPVTVPPPPIPVPPPPALPPPPAVPPPPISLPPAPPVPPAPPPPPLPPLP